MFFVFDVRLAVVVVVGMARALRIDSLGAIDHVMSSGNARQAIFRDDVDRRGPLARRDDSAVRCDWEALFLAFTF